MTVFSNDRDILRYEAALFGDLHFPWQVLCRGDGGVLSGATFTKTGAVFESAGASAGGVIYLRSDDGVLDGAYEIVSVDSEAALTISVLRADASASAVGPGDSSNVAYRVSTFAPQAEQVAFDLTQYFGIRPGNPDSSYGTDDIVDASVLEQASVYAVLAGAYATLGSKSDDGEGFWKKSLYYQKLFAGARERCRLSVDAGSDGVSDRTNAGGSIRLIRD